MIVSFPVAFLVHDIEEMLVQHRWMQAHRDEIVRRVPRAEKVIKHLCSLTPKAFAVAVLEELLLLLIVTGYCLVGGAYGEEVFTALFVAFAVHLVVHIGQGVVVRGYVPGSVTSIVLLPYAYYVIDEISREMSVGRVLSLGVIGFVVIVLNLLLAHWVGAKIDK
jgi:hypothetical protein